MHNSPNADAYFDEIARRYHRAAQATGTSSYYVSIADNPAQLNFAGDALVERIMPALAHLQTSGAPPNLTISLFDSVSTQTSLPPLPFPEETNTAEGWLYTDETHHILWNPFFNSLIMLDTLRARGFFWIADAAGVSYHETSFPLRSVWNWWLQPQGLQLAHAAAVANERGAAVIVGASGAGKSTVALSCLLSPLKYLGDDFILMRAEPEPRVYSLYCSAKLHADHWQRFPHLQNMAVNADHLDTEKALLLVDRAFPQKIQRAAPACAVLLPRVIGTGETRAYRIPAARALQQLAVSTVFLLHGAGKAEFETLARFIRQLPCYQLELGADLNEIPKVIIQVLDES